MVTDTNLVMLMWFQLKKYYQQRKSRRTAIVNLEATKVPLYGAGSSLEVSDAGVFEIPLRLEFEIRSKGEVVGKLVTTKHTSQISCNVTLKSNTIKPIRFRKDSCILRWIILSRINLLISNIYLYKGCEFWSDMCNLPLKMDH